MGVEKARRYQRNRRRDKKLCKLREEKNIDKTKAMFIYESQLTKITYEKKKQYSDETETG